MKNFIVHEIVTTCYTFQVSAKNEEEAIEKVKYNFHGYIPEYDIIMDIQYSAEEAFVLPHQLQEFNSGIL